MPEDVLFQNPYFHALRTEQAQLALGTGGARRFPADVIPFGGVSEPTAENMGALRDLLAPGETIYMTGITGASLPMVPELEHVREFSGLQMQFRGGLSTLPKSDAFGLRKLSGADAMQMVRLTEVAFPGFFRARTYTLGLYFGVESGGELVAMAGERLALPGWREVSAVCTHPAHTGRGYAAALIAQVLRSHAKRGVRSFLQVGAANARAIELYERLGFEGTADLQFHQLRRG